MILRYDYGTPIETGAIVTKPAPTSGILPHMTVSQGEGGLSFRCALGKDDMIFGLGETVRGINKRGHRYISWNTDEFSHAEDTASLYAAHNLLFFTGECGLFGVYFDDPGRITFDLGFSDAMEAVVTSENGDLSVYIIEGDSLKAMAGEFRSIIGQSYIAPKWAFGYIQSRWGYASEKEIRAVVDGYRSRHIPLDGVCLDIDYMDDFKDFTWNKDAFPDMKGLNDSLREEHIRLVPIIDAGIKEEKGFDIDDEGIAKDYYCKKENGEPFVGAVWPGRSHFVDFLREDARTWFGDKYRVLLDAGIEGFWNDMNEPALFYTPEGLQYALDEAEKLRGVNLGLDGSFRLKDLFLRLANNPKDYTRFWHTVDGRSLRHDKVHNLYGAFMTRAAAEAFTRYNGKKRYLLFSRASFMGAHRYGGVWQGDNASWWNHIKLNLQETASLNMCGFLYTGADLGGFGCDTTEDLLLRWLELGVFTPLMRNHSALHTRDQEVYRFGMQEDMKHILTVRYALIPYLYSEYMKGCLSGSMMFRPLAFDYPTDQDACRTEDQLMLGEEAMIAPVYEQNARGRHVYLPEDMLLVRFRAADDYDLIPLPKGHHWVALELNEMPLFIRRGCLVPLSAGGEWVDAIDDTRLKPLGWVDSTATYQLYRDDGQSTDVSLTRGLTSITVSVEGGHVTATAEGIEADVTEIVTEA